MDILVAPDSFKECLPACAVAEAIGAGWRRARPGDTVTLLPIADGGEGTVEALLLAAGGELMHARVAGPLGAPVRAAYGVLYDGPVAVLEMAAASGLALVPLEERNPAVTTSRGTGELLLLAACIPGVQRIVLGIGGSATNDGGAGFAQALGYRFLDAQGDELPPGGAALARLARIEAPGLPLNLPEIVVACDVNNPLCGPNGASHIYGPQKGATPAQAETLDAALRHYADIVEDFTGAASRNVPGAGAAGGLGFALLAFTGAELRPGIEIVAGLTRLEEKITAADLIITGEGRADAQSLMGKTVGGVLALAQRHGKRVAVLAGSLGPGHEALCAAGAWRVVEIGPAGAPPEARLAEAETHLRDAAEALACAFPQGGNGML